MQTRRAPSRRAAVPAYFGHLEIVGAVPCLGLTITETVAFLGKPDASMGC